jgi:hypothetical protein
MSSEEGEKENGRRSHAASSENNFVVYKSDDKTGSSVRVNPLSLYESKQSSKLAKSKDEYVFTEEAIRKLGKGSIDIPNFDCSKIKAEASEEPNTSREEDLQTLLNDFGGAMDMYLSWKHHSRYSSNAESKKLLRKPSEVGLSRTTNDNTHTGKASAMPSSRNGS